MSNKKTKKVEKGIDDKWLLNVSCSSVNTLSEKDLIEKQDTILRVLIKNAINQCSG